MTSTAAETRFLTGSPTSPPARMGNGHTLTDLIARTQNTPSVAGLDGGWVITTATLMHGHAAVDLHTGPDTHDEDDGGFGDISLAQAYDVARAFGSLLPAELCVEPGYVMVQARTGDGIELRVFCAEDTALHTGDHQQPENTCTTAVQGDTA